MFREVGSSVEVEIESIAGLERSNRAVVNRYLGNIYPFNRERAGISIRQRYLI